MPELPEEPSKLDIATMIANNWAKTGANVALSPLHMIKELMDHGYKPGTQDVQGVNNAAGVGLALMGAGGAIPRSAGAELGAFKSGILSGNKSASKWTEELDGFLRGAMSRNTGHGSRKAIMREFHAEHPNSGITDSAISSRISKLQNWGAPNKDIPIGSDVPNAAIDFLKSHQTKVDRDWIENWAKDAGVEISPDTRHGTTYFNMKSNISDKPVTVRLPEDAHWGRPVTNSETGRRFDTGFEPPIKNSDLRFNSDKALINDSGGLYAKPENLEHALELATGSSRGGEFKLVSPDYAPISRPKGEAFHERRPVTDPNQLKLFSNQTDPTTSLIIQALNNRKRYPELNIQNAKETPQLYEDARKSVNWNANANSSKDLEATVNNIKSPVSPYMDPVNPNQSLEETIRGIKDRLGIPHNRSFKSLITPRQDEFPYPPSSYSMKTRNPDTIKDTSNIAPITYLPSKASNVNKSTIQDIINSILNPE